MGLDIYCYKINEQEDLYFRKVNFLWSFCDNIAAFDSENGCLLTPCDIKHLISRCRQVLDSKTNKVSDQLLPTAEGCFFGSLEYDEGYYEDVQDVLDKFSKFSLDNPESNMYIQFSY